MAKIVIIGSYGESLIGFRGKLLEEMLAGGHEVVACSPKPTQRTLDKLTSIGAIFREIPFDRIGLNPLKDFRGLVEFIRLLNEFKPDIVLSYTIKPVIYGSICSKLTNVPEISSIITGLGYAFTGEELKAKITKVVVKMLYRVSIRHNNTVFFQNKDDMSVFNRLGFLKDRTKTILINGSGVDIDFFSIEKLPKKLTFLLIARLIKAKGIRQYVQAARIIKNKFQDVSFLLVGYLDQNPSSISKSELEGWVKEGVVEFLGRLDDVRPAIAKSSVYVLPSYYREGTPRTVLEAMAMGRPIITTDAPGCRETVENGVNGFLVPVKNVPALAESMERFISDSSLIVRMGRESRKIAEEKYDVEKVNRVILENLGLGDGRANNVVSGAGKAISHEYG